MKKKKLSILHLSWRDIRNPRRGGAETLIHETYKRLIVKGHSVTLFTAEFPGGKKQEVVDGINIVREGKYFSVHKEAISFWEGNRDKYDIVVDEIHGYPFFSKFYIDKPRLVHIDEVAGKIWFIMWSLPLSFIGFIFEKIVLLLIKKETFMTISDSTKDEMVKHGINKDSITIFKVGDHNTPVKTLEKKKYPNQIIYVGGLRKMKGIIDLVKAFNIVADEIPEATLKLASRIDLRIAEDRKFYTELQNVMKSLKHKDKIEILENRPDDERDQLVLESGLQISCSTKEGWGIIISEAAKFGTPSITYNVMGFRDIIKDGETGILAKEQTPKSIAQSAIDLLTDDKEYNRIRTNAHSYYKSFNFDNTAQEIEDIMYKTIENSNSQSKPNAVSKLFVKVLLSTASTVGTIYDTIASFLHK